MTGTFGPSGSRTNRVLPNGKTVSRPNSKRGWAWKNTVAEHVQRLRDETASGSPYRTLDPPYGVRLSFYHRRRKSKTAYPWPTSMDVDKLVRGTLDGLVQGGLLVDDRHVIELIVPPEKFGEHPGYDWLLADVWSLSHLYA